MLETLKLLTKFNELIIIKKINNFKIFLLNYNNHTYTYNKYYSIINNYYIYTFIFFFFHIMWRGKAYRVRFFKKSNKFTLNFGYSHWLKIIFNNKIFNFGKLKRQSYIVLFGKREDKFFLIKILNKLRILNKYTKRGIKIKKTPYIRRFGKISQVNSSLHNY